MDQLSPAVRPLSAPPFPLDRPAGLAPAPEVSAGAPGAG